MRAAVAATLLAVAACAPLGRTAAVDPAVYPDAAGMPRDIQRFIVQWQDCSHWLGEPDFDEARRREIARAVRDLCPGVDARGRRVRARHAANPALLARIASYGPLGQ